MQTSPFKGPTSSRSETIAVRLDPKVRYLLGLAARDQQRTVSSFMECVVRKALTEGFREESTYGTDFAFPKPPLPMWGEGLWDEDRAVRFFQLATVRHDLLTLPEQRLWKLLSESILLRNAKLNLQNFRLAFNDSMVDKTHLEEAE